MKCLVHDSKEAFTKCAVCKKPFCKFCVEQVGEKYVCFNCLKRMAKKEIDNSKKMPYKTLNIFLLISILCYSFIAIFFLFKALPLIEPTLRDLTTLQARSLLLLIGVILLLILEVSLIYISSAVAFFIGFLITIGLVLTPYLPFILGQNILFPELTNEILIFNLLLPLLGLIGLIAGKKGLEYKKFN